MQSGMRAIRRHDGDLPKSKTRWGETDAWFLGASNLGNVVYMGSGLKNGATSIGFKV